MTAPGIRLSTATPLSIAKRAESELLMALRSEDRRDRARRTELAFALIQDLKGLLLRSPSP